jgi:CubicO group peptidase (beta-lactamase class C family)
LSAAIPSLAATPAAAREFLTKVLEERIAPGAALVASRHGTPRLEGAVGTHCRLGDREAPLTLRTIHPLYSFSKLVTGTLVGIAKQEGKLDYDDRVSRHIPEFTGDGREDVTLRQCLTHAAGLTKPPSRPVLAAAGWKAALESLCSAPLEWEPGTRTAYHGWSGAFLAAECVRRVNKLAPWPALCRDKLFGPIGASTMSFVLPAEDADVAIVPQPDASKPLPTTAQQAFSYAGHPGAGCLGTLADALKVVELHAQEGVWEGKRLLDRSVWQEMHTVQYDREIRGDLEAGKRPAHEPWGLGPLLRGPHAAVGSHDWFGFRNQAAPGVFGHAGIGTFIGVGDPSSGVALAFATTHSPNPADRTGVVRNRATDFVFAELV